MNITVPREARLQPWWYLVYEDGETFLGEPGQWSSQAVLDTIDGVSVYTTEKRVSGLNIFDKDDPLALNWAIHLPKPLPLFAFSRHASSMGTTGASQWRYTCFGYTYLDHLFLFFVYPDHTTASVTPRSEPFVLYL